MPVDRTSLPAGSAHLPLALDRASGRPLAGQIEDRIRALVRGGALHAGTRLPSSRLLAAELGVSRGVVVEAYAQLAAEGFLASRPGARPVVCAEVATVVGDSAPPPLTPEPRFDFRPSVPDVSAFPRAAWARSLRRALATMPDADLQYGDPAGVGVVREALADYLGRVRGVVTGADRIVMTTGYTQGLALTCLALAARGARRVAMEEPANPDQWETVARCGLRPVGVPVDENGVLVERLDRTRAEAVIVTPAHQHPTGAVLSGPRRLALLDWLRAGSRVTIEDDYDSEYRYDRVATGALQGLDPDRVVYAGTTSKTLAPALRVGWLVLPAELVEPVRHQKTLADLGSARIEQHAFADFLARGEVDRHLRRMRLVYRRRRDLLAEAVAAHLPGARIHGIAAGLHVTVVLPVRVDGRRVREEVAIRGIDLRLLDDYTGPTNLSATTLMLGYGRVRESAIRPGVAALAEALAAAARRPDDQARSPSHP